MGKYDFSVNKPRKTAKETLINVGKIALDGMGAPEEISFLGFHYNIISKLCEEVAKRDEQTIRKTLKAITDELKTFS